MIEEFNKYVNNYDMNLYGISRKYNHSIRVMNLCRKYAKKLNYSDSDIELAEIIGILHDIGRFEQYQQYHSFNDRETFDHAEYGVKLLFEDGLITRFTNRVSDYDLIKYAIENHNKIEINECNNEKYVKFAKFIRDIDKLDIIYLCGYLGEFNCVSNDDLISDKVMNCLKENRPIKSEDVLNNNDFLAMFFGFVFDINNDIVLKEFKQNIYYFYKKIGGTSIFKEVYNIVCNYIDERIDKKC